MSDTDVRRHIPPPQREAMSSTVRHVGPTADLRQGALERYLRFVATAEAHECERGTATGTPKAPRRRVPPAEPLVVRKVSDVMTRGVVSAYPGASAKAIAWALQRNRIGAVPVIDADRRVMGVVSASDLLAKVAGGVRPASRGHRLSARSDARRKRDATTATDLMTSPAVTTTATATIAEAALTAARARVRSLPVVSSTTGELIGMVTRDDLIKLFLRDDADIREEVLRTVVRTHQIAHHANVTVSVADGVVTLGGRIDATTRPERLTAGVAAVPGVVAVRNYLESTIENPAIQGETT